MERRSNDMSVRALWGAVALAAAAIGLGLRAAADEKKAPEGATRTAAPAPEKGPEASGTIAGTVKGRWVQKYPAAVYLEAVAGKMFAPPAAHAKVDQKNLVFIPRVLPVLAGTTVDFQNSDTVLHNVFCPDECAQKFNLGTWGQGDHRSYTFANAGCVATLLCNVHPEMVAYVVVCPTPYFATTEKDGSFKIEGVPPGKYTVVTWHEKLKPARAEVVVEAGKTAAVEVEPTK